MKALRFYIFLLLTLSGCEKQELPRIITAEISSINQTSAICGGYIISEGSSEVISKGICYSTSTDPTIQEDSITIDSGVRNFTSTLTGLELHTTYFVRAYATNSLGTSYGKTKSFTTDPPYLPEVKTYWGPSTATTTTSATTGGEVTSDGASEIIDRGVCWSKSQNPDSSELAENRISAGSGLGYFYVTITDLESNTDYFVWAYATNLVGTAYSESRLFTTKFEPDPNLPVDPDYPTTFNRLDSTTLSQKRIAFAEKNKYLITTLDKFGFCTSDQVEAVSPPIIGNITKEEAIEIVKNFCLQNPDETGVENPDDLIIIKTIFRTSPDGDTKWYLESPNQIISTIEGISSSIAFRVINGEVVICRGNWFPQIYVPQSFFVDQEQAKSLLIGRVVKHLDFCGDEYYVMILPEYLNSSSVSLSIVPFIQDDKIELRVTWQIKVPSAEYIIFVDVMTGEIVYDVSMIIS